MFYVTMTDKFMSGLGMAKGRANKLVFICDTYDEAKIVYDKAIARQEMKYVNICSRKPSYYRVNGGNGYKVKGYYVQNKTKEDYPGWYGMEG